MEDKKLEEEKDMTPILIKDLGRMYPNENSKNKLRYGLFKCQYCGKDFKTAFSSIKRGYTKSCGCLRKSLRKTHGLSSHKFYHTWDNMMKRCYNPKNKDYYNYGGRGIIVCEEWLDIRNFIDWVEKTNIEGYTLDRIDNDKGYSPDNCRWADKTTQVMNRGIAKNNKSGYIGVSFYKSYSKWCSEIYHQGNKVRIGYYDTALEGALARDKYIKENNLPHKLAFPNDTIKEDINNAK